MRRFKSEAMQVIYEDVEGMFEDGIISAEQFHEFDNCLVTDPDESSTEVQPAVSEYASV